jgi:ATP synthase protein I
VGEHEKNPEQNTFEERLNRAQLKATPPPEPDRVDTASGIAFRMGVDLVAGTGVGAFLGYWVDKWFDTAPTFLIVLLIVGFVAGVRNVVRIARRAQEADAAESKD